MFTKQEVRNLHDRTVSSVESNDHVVILPWGVSVIAKVIGDKTPFAPECETAGILIVMSVIRSSNKVQLCLSLRGKVGTQHDSSLCKPLALVGWRLLRNGIV